MSRSLVTIKEDASIFDVARLMRRRKVGSLLVKDAKGVIGSIVTERDLVWKALAKGDTRSKVKAIASRPLVSVPESVDLADAARRMGKSDYKRLVVTKDSKIVGVLSERDILRLSPSLYDLIAEEERTGFNPERREETESARKSAILE